VDWLLPRISNVESEGSTISSTYDLANDFVDHLTGKAVWTAPSPMYIALFSTSVDRFGAGTEISGDGYARIETSASDWSTGSLGQARNIVEFVFGPAAEDWGTVFAAALVGPVNNVLIWKKIVGAPFRVNDGGTLVIDENSFVISIT
jgi:hypothetical protein